MERPHLWPLSWGYSMVLSENTAPMMVPHMEMKAMNLPEKSAHRTNLWSYYSPAVSTWPHIFSVKQNRYPAPIHLLPFILRWANSHIIYYVQALLSPSPQLSVRLEDYKQQKSNCLSFCYPSPYFTTTVYFNRNKCSNFFTIRLNCYTVYRNLITVSWCPSKIYLTCAECCFLLDRFVMMLI